MIQCSIINDKRIVIGRALGCMFVTLINWILFEN